MARLQRGGIYTIGWYACNIVSNAIPHCCHPLELIPSLSPVYHSQH